MYVRAAGAEHVHQVEMTSVGGHVQSGCTVAANGVENFRQRTPPNIVRIAECLLDAGADVKATCDVYGGGADTLGLVVTSAHPRAIGVQLPLTDLLLARGAILRPRLVRDSLANGCPMFSRWSRR